jgi:hypothetical protein
MRRRFACMTCQQPGNAPAGTGKPAEPFDRAPSPVHMQRVTDLSAAPVARHPARAGVDGHAKPGDAIAKGQAGRYSLSMRCALLPSFMLFAAMMSAPTGPAQAEGASVCLDYPYEAPAGMDQEQRLASLVAGLRLTLSAFKGLSEAFEDKKPRICLSPSLVLESGFLLPDDNRIEIDGKLDDAMASAVLLHELRHLDQVAADICPEDSLAMEQVARATFALEADANAITLLVAWHMRETGDPTVWDALAHWPSTTDIAARFARSMAETGDPVQAVAAAFDQWYASDERRQRYYIATCSDYLDRRDDSKRLPSYKQLPQDYLDRVCLLPDGTPYACRAPDF